jgi:Clr5 domain
MVLIIAGFMMAMATNPDLFPTASDSSSHDRFESFKDEIQELIRQQNYTNKEVVTVLAKRGVTTSLRSLERRLMTWGIRRP